METRVSNLPRPRARDRIVLTRIGVFARLGHEAGEVGLGRRLYVSVVVAIDLEQAGLTDDLAASVSYADIALLVRAIALEQSFGFIEALADAIASAILDAFPRIETASVTIDDPGVAVPVVFDGVSVTTTRRRSAAER